MAVKETGKIPVVIGVTGHRDLKTKDQPALKSAVTEVLSEMRDKCPHSPIMLLCSMAEGADLICAEAAMELGIPVAEALPLPVDEYEKEFSDPAREMLHRLHGQVCDSFLCPETEPHREGNDHRYRQAGIYVAEHSHLLLALWDGALDKPDGCGTAETVSFCLKRSYTDRPENSLQPGKKAVLQIVSRRETAADPEAEISVKAPVGEKRKLGDWDRLEEILQKTETFNRDADQWKARSEKGSESGDETSCYTAADELSTLNAGIHKKILAGLSAAATVLTVSFLLYDEAGLYWMILICGLMLLALSGINRAAKRLDAHKKSLEYRLLAEGIRVQSFLREAGSGAEACELLPWSWQHDLPWIKAALAALNIGEESGVKNSIEESWIVNQQNYHRAALQKMERKQKRSSRIVRICLCIAIISYIAALFFEIFWGGLFSGEPGLSPERLEVFRTWLKILLGCLSAATLFIGNYYGKLSLDEGMEDHKRMLALYSMTEQYIESFGEAEQLLIKLAREELGENSNWYAYQSMNAPEISL